MVTHEFPITDKGVEYLIRKLDGELVAKSIAEVISTREDDGHIRGMTIQTIAYAFEVLPVPDDMNGRFLSYNILRKPLKKSMAI